MDSRQIEAFHKKITQLEWHFMRWRKNMTGPAKRAFMEGMTLLDDAMGMEVAAMKGNQKAPKGEADRPMAPEIPDSDPISAIEIKDIDIGG